ncbi:MAG: response regulator [Chloroflexi bacterium]|nr:response regulator [Chloroflexota bacterium]
MKTVLIADDEQPIRRLVRATLTSDEYEILEAMDGESAWELAREHRPALYLLDVHMPGLSGLALTKAIRGDPELGDAQVILFTARALEADVRAGLEAGADHYLTKPFSPYALLQTVRQALGLG